MRNHLAPGCLILLDDARRAEERAIAQRWQAELNAVGQLVDDDDPFIRLVLPQRQQPVEPAAG